MITEDYCSFEVAKLLQNKGFDELCYACYKYFRSNVTMYSGWLFEYVGEPVHNTNDRVKCPTLQMAMKWLREVHKIDIDITSRWNLTPEYHICEYRYRLHYGNAPNYDINQKFSTYKQACEAAIKYCLTNLIE